MRLHRPATLRPSPAVVIASLALVAAVAQPAYAALARNSVGSPQIKDKSIQATDLKRDAVTSTKIRNGSVSRADLADGAVDFTKVADGTVGRSELAGNSVDGTKIVDGSVGNLDLAAPVQVRSWSLYPNSDVAVASGSSEGLGSLSANGGGPIAVAVTSVLTIQGQLYDNPPVTAGESAKGRISCWLAVDGTALAPRSWSRVEQGDEATVPVWGSAVVPAGVHDVSLTCSNVTGGAVVANLGRVGVSVLAVAQ